MIASNQETKQTITNAHDRCQITREKFFDRPKIYFAIYGTDFLKTHPTQIESTVINLQNIDIYHASSPIPTHPRLLAMTGAVPTTKGHLFFSG
jgi:hypothetical protein